MGQREAEGERGDDRAGGGASRDWTHVRGAGAEIRHQKFDLETSHRSCLGRILSPDHHTFAPINQGNRLGGMKGRAERAGSGQTRARGRVVTTRIAPPVTTTERPNVPTPAAAHAVPDCVPIGTAPRRRGGKDAPSSRAHLSFWSRVTNADLTARGRRRRHVRPDPRPRARSNRAAGQGHARRRPQHLRATTRPPIRPASRRGGIARGPVRPVDLAPSRPSVVGRG